MDTLNHWRLNLSLTVLMIKWTGSDQMLESPMKKQVVLLFFCSLLESHLACLRALASLWWCSCSVCVGFFWVTGPVCCRAWKCCEQIFVRWQVLVCFRDCCQFRCSFVDSWRDDFEASLGVNAVCIWALQFSSWFEIHSEMQVSVACPAKFSVWVRKEVMLASFFLTCPAACCSWNLGGFLLLVCSLNFGILFSTWACPRRKVCCWMWMFHRLCAVRNIWFSSSVIWCFLGCWLLPDPPARLIHVHQQSALFTQALCRHRVQSKQCWRRFLIWSGAGSVRCWFDLLLGVLWRSSRLLFSLISFPMGGDLQHLLMPSWKWFLSSQGSFWDRRLMSLFLTFSLLCSCLWHFWSPNSPSLGMPKWSLWFGLTAKQRNFLRCRDSCGLWSAHSLGGGSLLLIPQCVSQSSLLCLRGLLVPLCCVLVATLVLWLLPVSLLMPMIIHGQVTFCLLTAIGWCHKEFVDCCQDVVVSQFLLWVLDFIGIVVESVGSKFANCLLKKFLFKLWEQSFCVLWTKRFCWRRWFRGGGRVIPPCRSGFDSRRQCPAHSAGGAGLWRSSFNDHGRDHLCERPPCVCLHLKICHFGTSTQQRQRPVLWQVKTPAWEERKIDFEMFFLSTQHSKADAFKMKKNVCHLLTHACPASLAVEQSCFLICAWCEFGALTHVIAEHKKSVCGTCCGCGNC